LHLFAIRYPHPVDQRHRARRRADFAFMDDIGLACGQVGPDWKSPAISMVKCAISPVVDLAGVGQFGQEVFPDCYLRTQATGAAAHGNHKEENRGNRGRV
jgi:hypothetical protein